MQYTTIEHINNVYQTQLEFKTALKGSSIAERINWLKALRACILQKEIEIKEAIYKDFRKSAVETETTEILTSLLEINLFIKKLAHWAKPKPVGASLLFATTQAKLIYEPKGNSLIITPWNYPFQLPIVHLLASVAAGNTVMLKLSEFTPHTNQLLKEILLQVFDEQHVAVVQGAVAETTHLLSLKFDHIHFTGSPAVGKIVMAAAAKNLTAITLELGSKSPVFIDKNIHVTEVARNIIWAKFVNMGQTCIAPDYLLVDKSIEKEFDQALQEQMLRAFGEQAKDSVDLARINNERQFDRLLSYLEELKNSEAEYVVAGEHNKTSLFIHPTIVKKIPPKSRLMEDEIFGPILPIYYYSDVAKALEMVATKEKPLALYIFSKEQKYIDHILKNSTAGGTTINDALLHIMHPNLPFGGVNHSGIGQSLGIYGFKSFSHERAVLQSNYFPMSKLFWYPYTQTTQKMLLLIRKLFL